MKKRLCIIAFLTILIGGTKTHSQSLIARAGINISKFNCDWFEPTIAYYDEYSSLVGLHLGLSYEQQLKDIRLFNIKHTNLAIETGVFLNQKGGENIRYANVNYVEVSDKRRLIFLELPMNVKIGYRIKHFNFQLIPGFTVGKGFAVKSDSYGEVPLDFGLCLGIGVEYNNFIFNLTYFNGLSKNQVWYFGSKIDYQERNRYIQVALGYKFLNFKK